MTALVVKQQRHAKRIVKTTVLIPRKIFKPAQLVPGVAVLSTGTNETLTTE